MKYRLFIDLGEYPAAHRQWKHKGHCSQVHGHNWRVQVELEAKSLDDCGFVVDESKVKKILKPLVGEYLDHTLLIQDYDPEKHWFKCLEDKKLANVVWLSEVSMEYLSKFFLKLFSIRLQEVVGDRVKVVRVRVWEDQTCYVDAVEGGRGK